MLRRARTLFAGVADFVDSAYLRGVRPRVPGGGWTIPMLQVKSIADLQQLWFMLLRERNMLHSMRDHYMRHMEELGAFPAPSRLTFVENSMKNIRKVMQERDYEAVDAAEATFQDRIRKGVYRYPPGPQPPSTTLTDALSVARVTFSSRVEEARLRELLGRYDVFEGHRGIASLTMQPTSDTLAKKEAAEEAFEQWYLAQRDYEEYRSVSDAPSLYDSPDVEVELAPGVFVDDELRAGALPVPPPKVAPSPGNNPLDRIRAANRSSLEKQVLQLGYYPNLTAEPKTEPGPRPVHPDEIEGPWECIIVYGQLGGAEYLKSLNLTRIDGSDVLGIEDVTEQHVAELSLGAQTEEYTEVLAKEEAEAEDLKQWPISPEWKPSYNAWAALPPGEIIRFNYSNVVDYADREALLTGKSILEPPIKIDPTCGRSHIIPPHAKPPKNFLPDKPMAREEY